MHAVVTHKHRRHHVEQTACCSPGHPLFPIHAQRELAAALGAKVVETSNGHMEANAEAFAALLAHLGACSGSRDT